MSAVKGQGIFSLHLAIVTPEYLGEWIPYVKSEDDPLLTGIPCFESRNNTNCWWHVTDKYLSFLLGFLFFCWTKWAVNVFHWKATLEPLMRQRNYKAWWQFISRINQQNLYQITTFPGAFYPSICIHSFFMNIFYLKVPPGCKLSIHADYVCVL